MIQLTSREYEKQRRKGAKTNEGYIYTTPHHKGKIIKVIEPVIEIPKYIEIKQHTIELLLRNIDYIRGINVAIPEEGVAIDSVQRGFVASQIKGHELGYTLSNSNISLEDKINYLKQVGTILRRMKSIRENNPHLANFYYNDIHERNFIVNTDGIVYGIDPDSFSIQDNIPIQGYYSMLLSNSRKHYKKYKPCTQVCEYTTDIIPDENLDIYCYIRMILNFMYGKTFPELTEKRLANYLNYLESKGANLEFLYSLSYIFDDTTQNENPDYLLDCIADIYQYSNYYYDETGVLSRVLK